MRRRAARRLGDSHAHSRDEQLEKAAREPAYSRESAPHRRRGRQDGAPVAEVRPAGDGKPGERVDGGECKPTDEPELGVGQMQVLLDRLHHDDEDVAVHEVRSVDGHQHDQHEPGVARAHRLDGGCGQLCCGRHVARHLEQVTNQRCSGLDLRIIRGRRALVRQAPRPRAMLPPLEVALRPTLGLLARRSDRIDSDRTVHGRSDV